MMGWLKAEFMTRFLGEEFSGKVTGVTEFGIFVTLEALPVDGLVHISDLGGDYFEFDERFLTLTGRRSGSTVRLGDPFTIRVAGTDLHEGKISFSPAHRQTSKNKVGRLRKSDRADAKKSKSKRVRDGRRSRR